MKVELHLLQNFPPANLNRDDTGTPKDCQFGGERRARISSQCIKRSVRTSSVFKQTIGSENAIRTKRSAEKVASILEEEHNYSEDQAQQLAEAALDELISLSGNSHGEVAKTKVLYYVAPDELEDLASCIVDAQQDEEEVGEAIKAFVESNKDRARSVDIALFGRMLAEKPILNLEAASQVAHAISTNRVSMEFDFYTAVDDLNPDEETGAGMIGTTGYNSSCFYRYMLVDIDHLATNLSPEEKPTLASYQQAIDGVKGFVRAAVAAIPTGKQTSFAAQARPVFVLAVVRPDESLPMSLVNAFEKPARPHGDTSLVEDSVAKLDNHWKELTTMYGDEGVQAFLAMLDSAGSVEHLAGYRVPGINELVSGVVNSLNNGAPSEEVVA